MTACSAEPGESGTSLTGGNDDDDSTSGDDTTPSTLTASTVSTTTPATTDPSDGTTTGVDPTDGTTTGVDPTETTSGTTDPTTGAASTGSDGSTGSSTGISTGSTGEPDTTGGVGEYACAPYANAYAQCYYPDDLEYGYYWGLLFCQIYAGDCYGMSDECDALFDEWLACVTALDCKEYIVPPCPDELVTLQTTCMCGE